MERMTAAGRVAKYLEERKKMRGLHQEEITALQCGDEREAFLLASDLSSLVEQAGRVEGLEAAFEMANKHLAELTRSVAEPASQLDAPVPPEVAIEQKPVARLQAYESIRPYSKGVELFEVVILDRARCADGMELFATAPAAPVAAGLPASERTKVVLELPDGDQRQIKIGWSEMKDGVLHLCVYIVDAAAPVLSAEQPSQPQYQSSKSLPAARYYNKTGFFDADYIEFHEGDEYGGGVKDGIPHESRHYTRGMASVFIADGTWREQLQSSPIAEPDTATQAPSESIDTPEFGKFMLKAFNGNVPYREVVAYIHSWHQRATQAAKPLTDEKISDIDVLQLLEPFDLKIPSDSKIAIFRAIESYLKGE